MSLVGPSSPLRRSEDRLMLFDGRCGFCSGSVRFVAARSHHSQLRFCPMQSDFGQAALRALDLPLADYETLEQFRVDGSPKAIHRPGKTALPV